MSDTLFSIIALAEARNIILAPESTAYAATLGINFYGPNPDDVVRVRLLANGA